VLLKGTHPTFTEDDTLMPTPRHTKGCSPHSQVHAENGDAVAWGQRHVFEILGITGKCL